MALFAKIAETIGLFGTAERAAAKNAARQEIRIGMRLNAERGLDAYRRAFGHQVHRVTTDSGIKIVTLGERVPGFEDLITKRVDAFAIANPEAASRLGKIQLINPVEKHMKGLNWMKRDSDFSSLLRRSDEGVKNHDRYVKARAGNREYPLMMTAAGGSPGEWIGLHLGTGLTRGEHALDAVARNNDKIIIDLNDLQKNWEKLQKVGPKAQGFDVGSRSGYKDEFLDRILTHELGHVVHSVDSDRGTLWSRFALPFGKNPVHISQAIGSKYAAVSEEEAFAELYAASVHEPGRITPELQAILNEVRYGSQSTTSGLTNDEMSLARRQRRQGPMTPDRALAQPFARRHSSARSGLAIRSSATGKFR